METDLISNFSRVLAVHLKHLPVSHIAATFKHMEATSVFSLKVRHNFVKKLDMISHNSSRNIRPRVRVVSGMVVHGMRMQRVLLQAVLSVVIILLQLCLPHHLLPSKSEPAALPDQLGTLQLMPVFHQPAEKDNSTVLHRKNVSQDEPPVTTPSVSMIESVHETSLVSVLIVSTDEQMTKTSVVS
jgi:hypothetical protein